MKKPILAAGRSRHKLVAASFLIVLVVIGLVAFNANTVSVQFNSWQLKQNLANAHVGDSVEFGSIKDCDSSPSSSSKPIVWSVLKKETDRALVITTDLIGYRAYDLNQKTDYSSSSLCKYLNGKFKKTALDDIDASLFASKIEILHSIEIEEYMPDAGSRIPREASVKMWWTSTKDPGSDSYLQYVDSNGTIQSDFWSNDNGIRADQLLGVRPAVWIKFN